MSHDHYLSWYFIPTLLIISYNLLLVSKIVTFSWLLILCTDNTKCWGWGETAILIHCCEKVKWWSHFVRQLAVFYKTKHPLTIWCRNRIPWHLHRGVKTYFPHKTPHMHVYNSFLPNYQNLETTKILFSRWMDKYIIAYQIMK